MDILENINLAPYTTFKIGGPARYFCNVATASEAKEALAFAKEKNLPFFILGGGSNLLVSDSGFNGLVIKVQSTGIELKKQERDFAYITASAGESWDKVVEFAVLSDLWGIENLSHIPGSVGALAVQNVGAYGQEISKSLEELEVLNIETQQIEVLKPEQLNFGYRSSIFNTTCKNKYIIFSVTLKLCKKPCPNLEYRDLRNEFNGKNATLAEIRNAVVRIRDQKYPYPTEAKNGNAGSFFKNISLTQEKAAELLALVETKFGTTAKIDLEKKLFTSGLNTVKVPTAALIDLLGLKDCAVGGAKINRSQPLVILNESGSATAQDVLALANLVIEKIYSIFGLKVEIEPNLLGF